MLKSVLLYLESAERAAPVVRFGVSLAQETDARVRGLTLLDTRDSSDAQACESAIYASLANAKSAISEYAHEAARAELSNACLKARLDFDVRRIAGDPMKVLPREARFHDLVVVSSNGFDERFPASSRFHLSNGEITQLLHRGVQPILLLPPQAKPIERVLLAYDGSEAASRAIRSWLTLGVLHNAEYRLLAIGGDESAARTSLAEMAEYCSAHCSNLETGCAIGKTRRVLLPYAQKWEPDLLVLGINPRNRFVNHLLGHASIDLVQTLNCALFAQI